jgi:type I restriction enzyme R subunit
MSRCWGRATRRCDEIQKESFRIFDAVGLYETMRAYTDMRPVVTRPGLGFEVLVQELLTVEDPTHLRQVCDELRAKLQAKRARLTEASRELFLVATGHTSPDELLKLLADPAAARAFFAAHPTLPKFLDDRLTSTRKLLVSDHEDALVEVSRHFGADPSASACWARFVASVHDKRGKLAALDLALSGPAELTRDDLRALRMAFDLEQLSEATLGAAWLDLHHQEPKSNLVAFARHVALGEPLRPHAARVDDALARLLASRRWTDPQRKWLNTLANQCKAEVLVDRAALDRGVFKTDGGGFARLDRLFDGHLLAHVHDLHALIWA